MKLARKPTPGRRLSVDARRAEILAAAATLFTQRSYDRIGIADVAKAARITQGLLYHYFASKEALFAAAIEASAAELLRAALPDPDLPVPVQLELGLRGYLDYVEAHRVAYVNLFRGPASTQPEFQRIADRTRNAIMDQVIRVLGLEGRDIPATRLSLRGYIGYVEHAILEWLDKPIAPRATLERMIFTVFITALRMGLESDADVPLTAAELAAFERAFKAHFGLR